MKYSISNIAWNETDDEVMYEYINLAGFHAIEIAPTRLCKENPYDNIDISLTKAKILKEKYNLDISSMQSIWFGRNENIFHSKVERNILLEYTKKAIDYAVALSCNNLVFGCPRNRIIDNVDQIMIADEFFFKIGELANSTGVVIAFEPNPTIYNTNFINTTKEAASLIKRINSEGLKINMDLGTVIWNNEDLDEILKNIKYINHIHISEPYLEKIEKRELHKKLSKKLFERNYEKYVSIEMKNLNDINIVKESINYINEVMR